MQIRDVKADHFRIPLPAAVSDSVHGLMSEFELITVSIGTDSGVEGVGYTYTVGCGGASIWALIEHALKPVLVGSDVGCIEELWGKMWWAVHWVGRGGVASFAIAAVDIALWDIKGKTAGEPLWRLLGGAPRKRVMAYAGGIDLYFTLEQLRAQTESFLRQGFRAIKVKVGHDRFSTDLARLRLVREVVGTNFTLMADANMRWSVDEAIKACRVFEDLDLYWLEEPTSPDDIEGHARIASVGGLPIATGENMHTLFDFQRLINVGGVSFPEPDVCTIGGITPWMKVAHLAEANHLPVTSHGAHDLHVHLLAAVPNASLLEVHGFGLDRFIREPLRLENGEAIPPGRPGHGVEFLWDRLRPYRVDHGTYRLPSRTNPAFEPADA
jgi:L-alanine-DL-glutamate epimerase-like enolase superfamily enzyme